MAPSFDDLYDRPYFEETCGGHAEFRASRGETLPGRIRIALESCPVAPGQSALDLGSGRGELLLHLARAGAEAFGLDRAPAALAIAGELRSAAADRLQRLLHLLRGDSGELPFPSDSFDRVYLLDLVEHLEPSVLERTLLEARRVVRRNGAILIHTMPNLWYYRLGYPLYRAMMALRGTHLPGNPRERVAGMAARHVNEQSPRSLRRALAAASLRCRVWLQPSSTYSEEPNRLVRYAMRFGTNAWPLRAVLCDDIFALAWKR